MDKNNLHLCDDCGNMNCKGRGFTQVAHNNEPFLCKGWKEKKEKQQ